MKNNLPDGSAHRGWTGVRTGQTPLLNSEAALIAPRWHTVGLVCVLGFIALSGYLRAHTSPAAADYYLRSVSSMVSQGLLAGAMVAGLYHRREFFAAAVWNRRQTLQQDFSKGVMVYLAGIAIIVVVGLLFQQARVGVPDRSLLHAMLPHTWVQLIPWLGVSVCAGVGEELVFRGYLLQQVSRWLGSAPVALVVTSLLFGVMHAYEGWSAVVSLTGLAALYAAVTIRSGNIRAVAIAHTLQDFVTALFYIVRHRAH